MNRATFLALLGICCTLTMGGSGEIQGTNYTINQDGITITASDDFDITLGSNGVITNANADFIINEDGFSVEQNSSNTPENTFSVIDGSGDTVGGYWGSSSAIFLESVQRRLTLIAWESGTFESPGSAGAEFNLNPNASGLPSGITTGGSTPGIRFKTNGDPLIIPIDDGTLPTSDPANPGQIWRDGATLKVSLTT